MSAIAGRRDRPRRPGSRIAERRHCYAGVASEIRLDLGPWLIASRWPCRRRLAVHAQPPYPARDRSHARIARGVPSGRTREHDAVRLHAQAREHDRAHGRAHGQAEDAGFEYGWIFDSHVLWREPYILLTLMAQATERMRLRDVRDESGDARAVRDRVGAGRPRRAQRRPDGPRDRAGRLGATGPRQAADDDGDPRGGDPASSSDLVEGRTVEYEGTELQLPWTGKWTLPVWVAGYGPMALAMTGRIADGVILQLADPDLIRWFVGQVRERRRPPGARRAPSRSRRRRRPMSATWRCAGSGRAGSPPSSPTTSSISSTSTRASSCRSP